MSKIVKINKKRGQSLVEYGLILSLVSIVSITVLQILGQEIKQTLFKVTINIERANQISKQSF